MKIANDFNIFSDIPEKEYVSSVSLAHRKHFAQYFTPYPIAQFMANWIIANPNCKTILDPAFGLGILGRVLLEKDERKYHIKGYELDTCMFEKAQSLWEETDVELLNKDYMFNDWENQYDGIIANPPYLKFHDYTAKDEILKIFQTRLGFVLTGFTNLYALFLLKSIHQLKIGGRAAYLIPSEFLNSDYGKNVKQYLIQNKSLRQIIVFDFKENVFDDVLTTASIFLFENSPHQNASVVFKTIKTIDELYVFSKNRESTIHLADLDAQIKWRNYYQPSNRNIYKNLVPLSTYGKVVRGNFDSIAQADKKIFLLNATGLKDAQVKKYIELGEQLGVHKKFLTSRRNPWFVLEKRLPSPIWVTVFNRNGLRFVRNKAEISNLTTFHCLYLNIFAAYRADLLFAYLLTDVSRTVFKLSLIHI
jgi:adenine-specific DNA-methyltransferase